ncbi:MAG: hypothetical protein IPO29_03570 [Anaerolineae bacterium]|nr:hypothetical protein [Anaerolineae bacterium]
MTPMRARFPVVPLFAISVLLAACAPQPSSTQTRVELPQQLRLGQNALATTLERRSGRIAVIDASGNVLVMDQTGGDIRRLTVDANVRASGQAEDESAPRQRSGPNVVRYQLPVWSPDASRLAISQVTLQPSTALAYVAQGIDSVTLRPGADGDVMAVDAAGRQTDANLPTAGVTITRPGTVYVLPSTAESESRVAASALYIAAIDGKTPLREVAAARGAAHPYYDWSPDGAQLAVLTQATSGTVPSTLALVSADGASGRMIYRGLDAYWDWNHDGSAIFNHGLETRTTGDEVLGVISARSGGVTPAGGKEDYPFFAPHYSPDGRFALLGTRVNNKPWLSLADAMGQPVKPLVALEGLAAFAWSPLGGQVAYTTRALSSEQGLQLGALHLLDVVSGEDRVLSRRPTVAFFWSPDGSRLAVFSPATAASAESFAGVVAVTENTTAPYALYSLDPRTGAGRALLLFEPTPQFDQVLRRFDRYSRGLTIWSPDSLRLVVPILLNEGSQGSTGFVLEMEATGSVNPRVISAGGVMAVWSPR